MRKAPALGTVAVALAVAGAGVAAGTNPNTLTLAIFGDSPYLDSTVDPVTKLPKYAKDAEFQATSDFINTINQDPSVQAVIHVGDIHSGSEPCRIRFDQAVFDKWKVFLQPLIYTPGDNEWSDCSKTKELSGTDVFGEKGPDNVDPTMPLEELGQVRSIFFANPGWTLGQHPMQVISQAYAYDPAHGEDGQFVENVMWEQSKTVFVTLNIPGGSNNDMDAWYGKSPNPVGSVQSRDMQQRTDADVRWLNAAFTMAEEHNAHSVVIIGQADVWDTADSPSHQTNYEPIVLAIAMNATAYGKPVLYLNGDSHVYRSDNPLQKGSMCDTETNPCDKDAWLQHPYYDVSNFHRIVVHGSTFPLEWLKLSIDPRAAWENASTPTSWGPFSWRRETQAQLTPPPAP
jgi:hypothetical protein